MTEICILNVINYIGMVYTTVCLRIMVFDKMKKVGESITTNKKDKKENKIIVYQDENGITNVSVRFSREDEMNLREYRVDDYDNIIDLFFGSVHSVCSKDYTEFQLEAWAPKDKAVYKLSERLSTNYAVVVENGGVIIGFGNVNGTGYFDCLYTHKDYQGIGVATLIADDIEKYFFRAGVCTITTDASITAKPFFEKRGYVVQKEQIVECRGQFLTNFKMQKIISRQQSK